MPLNLDFLKPTEQKAVKRRIAFWLDYKIQTATDRFDNTALEVYEQLKKEVNFE